MMDQLTGQVAEKLGINAALAEKVIGIVLSLVRQQGDQTVVGQLFDQLDGAGALADQYGGDGASGGGLLSMLGGGAMGGPLAAVTKLQSAGLDMEQIKVLGGEVLDYAKEHAGEDLVKQVASSIPGLSGHV